MSREVMRRALEALENTSPMGFNMQRDKQFYAAITALRTALQTPPPPPEAQTDGEKNAYHYGWWAAMEAVRKQRTEPEQCANKACAPGYCYCAERTEPEQEPVAYVHRQGNHWEVSERFLCDDEKARGWTEEPLYAHPAPQPVTLTDEEIAAISAECASSAHRWDDFEFARAVIEAYQRKQEGKA